MGKKGKKGNVSSAKGNASSSAYKGKAVAVEDENLVAVDIKYIDTDLTTTVKFPPDTAGDEAVGRCMALTKSHLMEVAGLHPDSLDFTIPAVLARSDMTVAQWWEVSGKRTPTLVVSSKATKGVLSKYKALEDVTVSDVKTAEVALKQLEEGRDNVTSLSVLLQSERVAKEDCLKKYEELDLKMQASMTRQEEKMQELTLKMQEAMQKREMELNQAMEKQNEELNQAMAKQKEELNQAMGKQQQLEKVVKELVDDKQQLEKVVKELVDDKQQLEMVVKELVDENQQLQKVVKELVDEKQQLQKVVKDLVDEKQQLQKALKEMADDKHALMLQVGRLEKALGEVRVEHEMVLNRMQALEVENGAIRTENGAIRTENGALKLYIHRTERVVEQLQEDLTAVQAELTAVKAVMNPPSGWGLYTF